DAQDLVARLMKQIEPFGATFHLDQQVSEVQKHEDGTFTVSTNADTQIRCKAVVIAGGVGSFQPMPLRVDGVDDLVDQQVFYRVKDPSRYHGKDLVVLGGGDSAFDWVLELAPHARSMVLIHRSDKFRAAPASVAKMEQLVASGKMKFAVGNVVRFERNGTTLKQIEVRAPDESLSLMPLDHLLVFFGLSPKL